MLEIPAGAAQFELKCATNQTLDHPLNVRLNQMWVAVERESGGRIKVRMFPQSVLGSDDAMFSQLRLGAIDFFAMTSGNLASVVPAADISFLGFAFKDADEALRVMDGPLGGYLRDLAAAKGLYALHAMWDSGMLQATAGARPIRTPDDMRGFKMRVTNSKILVELLKDLGASPAPVSFNEVYTALQTRLVDGALAPLPSIQGSRWFEVQKYLSLTNLSWGGQWLMANGNVWKSLPPNLAQLLERNNTKYALLQRRDIKQLNASLLDKLEREGMIVNRVDTTPFRAKLKSYYESWATTFGSTEWGLLEASLGRKLI